MTERTNLSGYLNDDEVAERLNVHPVTVRRWRAKNKKAGCIKHGPPYEFRGPNVVYPEAAFNAWRTQDYVIGGVIHYNEPASAGEPRD